MSGFARLIVDNHLFAVNKPAGLPTQTPPDGGDSLESLLKREVQAERQKAPFLTPVHRLDRPASGIVLFAASSKALSRLNAALRNGEFKKSYLALVEGSPPQEEGLLDNYLRHGDHRAHIVNASHPEAKRATLTYRTLRYDQGRTLLEIDLQTGRYHQIRAQLAFIGCPIIGDAKYGSKVRFGEGIALHHHRLSFPHPVGRELVELVVSASFA